MMFDTLAEQIPKSSLQGFTLLGYISVFKRDGSWSKEEEEEEGWEEEGMRELPKRIEMMEWV